MRPALVMIPLLVATLSAGCLSTSFGREFPSPDSRGITVGKTDKSELLRLFGEPYQVGIDSGESPGRWFFGLWCFAEGQTISHSVRSASYGRPNTYASTF